MLSAAIRRRNMGDVSSMMTSPRRERLSTRALIHRCRALAPGANTWQATTPSSHATVWVSRPSSYPSRRKYTAGCSSDGSVKSGRVFCPMTVISGYSSRMNFIIARTGSGSLVICSGKAIMSKVTVTPMTLSVLVSRAL